MKQTPRPIQDPSAPQERGYYEYLPPGYGAGSRFPLVVFFHGGGERGSGSLDELSRVLLHGPPKLIERGMELPAIVISPQTASRWLESVTVPFVEHILGRYDVDRNRVYITGLSLGGEGTWRYARSRSSGVAAIVPICGPKLDTGYRSLAGVPIWTFHGLLDDVVPIDHTLDMLEEISGVRPPAPVPGNTFYFDGIAWNCREGELPPRPGENPSFTVYPGGHDSWSAAYLNQGMWDWLFSSRRAR